MADLTKLADALEQEIMMVAKIISSLDMTSVGIRVHSNTADKERLIAASVDVLSLTAEELRSVLDGLKDICQLVYNNPAEVIADE